MRHQITLSCASSSYTKQSQKQVQANTASKYQIKKEYIPMKKNISHWHQCEIKHLPGESSADSH